LANHEPEPADRADDPGITGSGGSPEGVSASPGREVRGKTRSIWSEFVMTPGDQAEQDPPNVPAPHAPPSSPPAGYQPGPAPASSPTSAGAMRWPASELPPWFGQQPADAPAVGQSPEPPPDQPGQRTPNWFAPGPAGRGNHASGPADPGFAPSAAGPAPNAAPADPAGFDEALAPPPSVQPPQPVWQPPGTAESLTADVLLPGRHARPTAGWRRALYQVSGGLVRAPETAADRRRRELIARARTPVAGGHHRVAVLSLKGGVGKTTTTMGLGATLASQRGDRVIAVDANPDRGTLCDKLRLETAATIRDLLNERNQIHRYADVRAYTTQAPNRLEVLASDRDPTVSVAFSAEDYEDVASVLENFYSICVTDCGTGLLHSAMGGVLRLASQIVIVSSPSVDGARSASATLDWLAAHNYGDLARSAVFVLCAVRPRTKSTLDLGRLEQHFAARCRAVVRIPYDTHLAEGAEVELDRLSKATADAYLMLAAEIGDGFAWPAGY
jgi:MinD-like ATPase involved in chromosome partitioning or flagellar assembly